MIKLGVGDSIFESIISWANLYQRPVTVSGQFKFLLNANPSESEMMIAYGRISPR